MSQRLEQLAGESVLAHSGEPCFWWEGQWHDGAELLRLADACERALIQAGFTEGQRLVVMMKNCPMIPALSLAVWRLGGAFCPLNVVSGMTGFPCIFPWEQYNSHTGTNRKRTCREV